MAQRSTPTQPPDVDEATAAALDAIFDPARFRHLAGDSLYVDWARDHGREVVGFCGFRRVPLAREVLDILAECPVCDELARSIADARADWGRA